MQLRRTAIFLFLCLQAIVMQADVVKARVVDADSGEPLAEARVEFSMFPLGEHWAMIDELVTDSLGCFVCEVSHMSRINLKVDYFGYEQLRKSLNVPGGKDTLDLGDLRLKMSEEMMKEVLVKGKAKQFYMKGDTVVFNPDAFNLDDGDRVITLLKKLPGVSIKDGKLYFMGKEVHLKMNGYDAADDILMAQLPAEAVQNIKAYEKKSETEELTGMQDGQEQQVLDIIIKPGFMDRWYGQTNLTGYASPNYRASANMHYLTDKDPINVYARASDCGSKTYGVFGDFDYDWDSATPQRQQYGRFSYRHNWKVKNAQTSYDQDHWSLAVSPDHNDTHQHNWSTQETFLSSASSLSKDHNYSYDHGFKLPLDFDTELHFDPKTSLQFNVRSAYNRQESHSNGGQETYRTDSGTRQAVNSSSNTSQSHSDNGNVNTSLRLSHVFDRGDVYVSLSTKNEFGRGHSDQQTDYQYHELGTSESLRLSDENSSNLFQTIFDTKVNYQLVPKKVRVGVGYWVDYWHKSDDSDMLRNGVFDKANSFDRTKSYLVNEPRVEMETDLGKVWLHAAVKLQNVGEDFDYQRGKLDTTVHRTTWFPRPAFDFKWQTSKTTELKVNTSWDYHVADLLNGLDYTDDTNPLSIQRGNPRLRASSNLYSGLSYNMMFARGEQLLTWNFNYNRVFNPATTMSWYNPATGGYITSHTNVDYNQSYRAGLNYNRALGKYFHLSTRTDYRLEQVQGIKTQTAAVAPQDIVPDGGEQYCQTSSVVSESLNVDFNNNGWEAAAWCNVEHSGISYTDPALSGQNLWHYRLGMKGKYIMKHWTFNLDGALVGNSGYLSSVMNRKRVLLNASVTWKLLKNKAQLTLSAKDILNQMAQTYSNMTATSRTEIHTESFHRYLSLSFVYNIEAKKKK